MFFKGDITHVQKLRSPRGRICGSRRSQVLVSIMSNGLHNVFNDQVIAEGLNLKKTIEHDSQQEFNLLDLENKRKLAQVLRTIKSKGTSRIALSQNIIDDVIMTKSVIDGLDSFSTHINGYVQQINGFPFGFLLLCEIQVYFCYFAKPST